MGLLVAFFLNIAHAQPNTSPVYPFILQGYRPLAQGKNERIEIVAEQVGSQKSPLPDELTDSKILLNRPHYQLSIEGKRVQFKKKSQAVFACPGRVELQVASKPKFKATCASDKDTITMNLKSGVLRVSNGNLEVLKKKQKYQGNTLVLDPKRRVLHYYGTFKSKGKSDRNRQIASF